MRNVLPIDNNNNMIFKTPYVTEKLIHDTGTAVKHSKVSLNVISIPPSRLEKILTRSHIYGIRAHI